MTSQRFKIDGMTCSACERAVTKAISKLSGVASVNVNLLSGFATVEFDEFKTSTGEIENAVKSAGYSAERADSKSRAGKPNLKNEWESELKKNSAGSHVLKLRLITSIVLLVPLLFISMGSMLGISALSWFMQESNATIFALIQFILTSIIVIVNKQFFVSGTRALIKRSPNMDTLVMLGAGASYIYGAVVMFLIAYFSGHANHEMVHKFMHSLYFESCATILTLVTLGKFLEGMSKKRTTGVLDSLVSLKPKTVHVLRNGRELEILAEEVVQNDKVLIRVGDVLPVDGEIIEGEGLFDQSSITGESLPVKKSTGEKVVSASICVNGSVVVRADSVGENTTLAEIIKLVDEAGSSKAPIARIADKVSGVFVPIVMLISVLTLIVWLLVGASFGVALTNAVAVLVISCPCALGLATPVAIMVGTGVSAKNGVLFKSAEIMERLSKVKTVILDKTGTITEGKLAVTDVEVLDETQNREKLLSEVSAIETHSNHPIAKALVEFSTGDTNYSIKNYNEVAGEGVSATISGKPALVGNLNFVTKNLNLTHEELSGLETKLKALSSQGKTAILYAKSEKIVCIIAISDKIRESSGHAIALLKKNNLKTIMLSGDSTLTASAVASSLMIDEVIAEVLPAQKEEVVRRFQTGGECVVMVGDGINDSPALTQADVGMAVGSGTDIAGLSADVILTSNSLMGVVNAIKISKATMRNIKINLFWAFFYNVLCIPLAAGVWYPVFGLMLSPMIASLAMSFSSVCVVLNALLLNLIKPEELSKNAKLHKNNEKIYKKGAKIMKKIISIDGMMCGHCVTHVTEALAKLEGIKQVDVSLEDKCAVVVCKKDISDNSITGVIADAGYKVTKIDNKIE